VLLPAVGATRGTFRALATFCMSGGVSNMAVAA
jgi:hypothetical protein